MFTPTALMNPTITALETNRRSQPSFRSPAASMMTPVRIESVTSARSASADRCNPGMSATIMAIAPVPWIAMNEELVIRAPVNVPTM